MCGWDESGHFIALWWWLFEVFCGHVSHQEEYTDPKHQETTSQASQTGERHGDTGEGEESTAYPILIITENRCKIK